MATGQSLSFSRTIQAPGGEVFRAFVHPTLLRDWLCSASSADANENGYIFLRWSDGNYAAGSFTVLEPPSRLEFTWNGAGEPGVSRVQVEIEAQGDHSVLTLRHVDLGEGAEWEQAVQRFQEGWEESLENLQSVLETGVDLRLVRKPRLGIFIDEFNAEIAAKLGVPVTKGIHIAGTADNTGARAAGLEKGDVLVSLNGKPLTGMDSFGPALKGLHAGDKPAVVYYRGAEQHTVPLELSRFPIPDLPATAAELEEKVLALQKDVNAKLDELFAGKSEAQAAARPAPEEWNAKELLAHLVLCERDYQSWVASMLNDRTVKDNFEDSPNVTARLGALIDRLGSVEALRAELRQAEAETAAMIRALPAEFVKNRKHYFRRAAEWALVFTRDHLFEEHQEQIKAALG